MPWRHRALAAGLVVLACTARGESAQEQGAEPSPALTLRTSVKITGLISRTPDAPELFADRTIAQSMIRFRLEPRVRAGRTTVEVAYDQRLHYQSGASGIAANLILPSDTPTPYRLTPLVWRITGSRDATWRQEIDRANVQVRAGSADLTIGRQAIGWGRGVMFTAVDLFAPFSPLDIDRDWRAGVDAVRAEVRLIEHSSVDLVGAFADTLDRSAFAARARGYAGIIDLELIGGRRAEDLFAGVTSSAAVGDAEVHGEAAVFRVPSGAAHDLVWKVVLGGSHRLPVASGILVYAEYHYSGFGAADPNAIIALLRTPSFLERLLRGDTAIVGRHAIGVAGRCEVSPEITYSGRWLHNPADRSGVVAPEMTYTFNDTTSLLGSLYVPYGQSPQRGVLRSEYGASSLSALVQVRLFF